MENKNDTLIMTLKNQIDAKKKMLRDTEKFSPVTNCSLEIFSSSGIRHNLHTLNKEKLISLLVELNAYRKSAEELGLLNDYIVSGYSIEDWITDLRAKLMNINRAEEQRKLRELENKLNSLLSAEKKVEMELEEIANLLK